MNVLELSQQKAQQNVAIQKGFKVIKKFFGVKLAKKLAKRKKPDLIVANNVLAHVPNINDFILGMKFYLNSKRSGIDRVSAFVKYIKKKQFDTIYHEHYSYLSLISAQRLFLRHKLEIYDVERIPTHGGSLRIYIKHKEDKSKKKQKN